MALPALPIEKVIALNDKALHDYFDDYARFDAEAPQYPYVIRFGSRTLFSDNTMDLWQQFKRTVTRHRKGAQ